MWDQNATKNGRLDPRCCLRKSCDVYIRCTHLRLISPFLVVHSRLDYRINSPYTRPPSLKEIDFITFTTHACAVVVKDATHKILSVTATQGWIEDL